MKAVVSRHYLWGNWMWSGRVVSSGETPNGRPWLGLPEQNAQCWEVGWSDWPVKLAGRARVQYHAYGSRSVWSVLLLTLSSASVHVVMVCCALVFASWLVVADTLQFRILPHLLSSLVRSLYSSSLQSLRLLLKAAPTDIATALQGK